MSPLTLDQLHDVLDHLVTRGSAGYRATVDDGLRADLLAQISGRLDADGQDLVNRYEELTNQDTDAWGDDRFRIGYALGASGLTDRLDALGLPGAT